MKQNWKLSKHDLQGARLQQQSFPTHKYVEYETEPGFLESVRTYLDEQSQIKDIFLLQTNKNARNKLIACDLISCLTTQNPQELLFYPLDS